MAIEPDPYYSIKPGADIGLLVARRMGCASWLTAPDSPPSAEMSEHAKQPTTCPVPPVLPGRPGFFVDFTDCEDLLEEFSVAAMKAGLSPSDSALDLIYLFANGELHLKV